jgi:hypothetical protein
MLARDLKRKSSPREMREPARGDFVISQAV